MNSSKGMEQLEEENRRLREQVAGLESQRASLEAERARLAGELQKLRRRLAGGGSTMSTKLQDALRE